MGNAPSTKRDVSFMKQRREICHHKSDSIKSAKTTKTTKRNATRNISSSSVGSLSADESTVASDDRSPSPPRKCNYPDAIGPVIYGKHDPIPEGASAELKLVREWCRRKDRNDMDGCVELFHPHAACLFVDSEVEMPVTEFGAAITEMYNGFPDLSFDFKSLRVAKNDHPDPKYQDAVMIIADEYGGKGTHTRPYCFGPFPPIDPTGLVVRDEPVELTFWVRDNKILYLGADAFGYVIGPPGFYEKIGGLVIGM